MRRVAFGAVAALALATSPSAVAGVFGDGEYGGRLDRDSDQFISFDVVKANGKRFVTHVELVNAAFTCADPMGNGPKSGALEGRFRIRNGRFGGEKSYSFAKPRGESQAVTYSIDGRFVTKRKVRGEFRIRLRGSAADPCVTGKVPYAARRPAPTPPPIED